MTIEKQSLEIRDEGNGGEQVVVVLAASSTAASTSDKEEEIAVEIKDGGLEAWLAVLATFMVHVVVIGIPTTFGIFQQSYASNASSYIGPHSTVAIAFIGSFTNCGLGLFSVPSGRMSELFGNRQMCAIGGLLVTLSLVLASYSTQYWQLFLTQGVMFGAACAVAYFPALTIISHHFDKKKGFATGIAVSGSGLGGLAISPLANFLIENYGTSGALRYLGIGGGVILLISSLFLKPRLVSSQKGGLNYMSIINTSRFVKLFGCTCFSSLGYFIPFFFIPTFAVQYGMTPSQGALCVGLMNGASGIGRIFLGFNADALGHLNTLWVCLTAASVMIFIWPATTTFATLVVFSIFYGFFIGGFISLMPTAIISLFGTKDIATITGLVYSGFFIGNLCGPPIAGVMLDGLTTVNALTGITTITFWPAQVFSGLCMLIGSFIMLSTKIMIGKGEFLHKC